jgi:hypothetical protein
MANRLVVGGLGGPFLLTGGLAGVTTAPFDQELQTYLAARLGTPVYPDDHVAQVLALPAFTYTLVGEDPYYTLRAAAGLTAKVYQFDSWATSKLAAARMELALRGALHGFRGMMGGTYVSGCRLRNCLDMPYEPNVDGSDGGTYRRVAEYRIAYREPVPIFVSN